MHDDIRKKLGEKARELRKQSQKTQQEVAEALNIARTDISGFESKGERITTLEKIETLFAYFGYELTLTEKKNTPTYA